MKRLILLFTISIFFYSCEDTIKTNVINGIKEATDSMNANYLTCKDSVNKIYPLVLKNTNGSVIKKNIIIYHAQIMATLNFIDSLKFAISEISDASFDQNLENKVFIETNSGNILLIKLKACYDNGMPLAKNNTIRNEFLSSESNVFNEKDSNKLLDFYFGSNNPTQWSWILSGFEIEILKTGNNCFKSYLK